MALYVTTNLASLRGRNQISYTQGSLQKRYQRLSSGLRINSSKDDAAGLQIADRLTSQINGLNQGNRNINDGLALAQTIDGALDESINMLQRIRILTVQSLNGTNSDEDRAAIQSEVTELSKEITRVACKTTFGGQQILAGNKGLIDSLGRITVQVGANSGDTLVINGLSLGFVLSQVAKGTKDANYTKAFTQDSFDVKDMQKAPNVLSIVDKVIGFIDNKRSDIGAVMNRMESSIRNQSNVSLQTEDARSRISDSDFSEESALLTQQSIVQNITAFMLVQTNLKAKTALHLLS